jgi:hypothetical protein
MALVTISTNNFNGNPNIASVTKAQFSGERLHLLTRCQGF